MHRLAFLKHKKIPRSTHTRYTLKTEMLQKLPPAAWQARQQGITGLGGASPSRTPRAEKEPEFIPGKLLVICTEMAEDMLLLSLGKGHC